MGLYDKRTGSTSIPYSSRTTEPSIRKEMIHTLDGFFPEIAKGHYVILRKARLDSNNQPISCPCVDSITLEPDKTTWCPVCYGSSIYFDEEWILTYSTYELSSDASLANLNQVISPGIINIPSVVFYTRYSDIITNHDRIVRVALDADGSVSIPVNRLEIYRVNFVWEYRSDNGKLEYHKIATHKQEVKYLNAPSWNGDE